MHIIAIGTNHQTTPVSIRERVAISAEKMPGYLEKLRPFIPQGVILSTCNRTEIYTVSNDVELTVKRCHDFLKNHLNISAEDLKKHVYMCRDREAAEHLLRVASGLESMIVGEYEVLSQTSRALEMAEKAGMVNLPLRNLFRNAVRTGRLVRSRTAISKNAMSISSVAVDLASSVHGNIKNCKIIVIGAGEAGRLAVKIARERGATNILVVSRTRQRAVALAERLEGIPLDRSRLLEEMGDTHIVISCSGAPHWSLDAERVGRVMKNRASPLVLIDIAVPRNVSLYNIDDLTRMVESNRKQREGEVEKASAIIETELDKFMSRWEEQSIRPVLRALMGKAEAVRSAQLKKTVKKLPDLSDEELENLEAMTRSIVNRILQDPIEYLKMNSGNEVDHAETLSKIFDLTVEEEE